MSLLVVLAGFIAFAGDRLGTLVGRRRLSLFGARPKRTGQIVGVLVGILIMVVTLGVSALAFRGATSVILNAQRTSDELVRLRAQEGVLRVNTQKLQQQIEDLSAQLEQLGANARKLTDQNDLLAAQNRTLEARNEQLTEENARFQEINASLDAINKDLSQQIRERNDRVNDMQAQVSLLEQQLEQQTSVLQSLRDQFEQISSGDVTYRKDELVHSGVIRAQSPGEIREELAQFVRTANEETARRGAGEVTLSAEQFNTLVSAVGQSPEADLVRLLSPRDQFGGEPVAVTIESVENTRLFDRGQLIVSRRVHLGGEDLRISQSDVRNFVLQLIRAANQRLLRAGLVETELARPVNLTEENFTNQLLRLTGPVTIGVVAAETIFRGGPAPVELVILD